MIPTIPGYHGDDPTDARLAVFPMIVNLLPSRTGHCSYGPNICCGSFVHKGAARTGTPARHAPRTLFNAQAFATVSPPLCRSSRAWGLKVSYSLSIGAPSA